MALIKCKECGKEISDTLDVCIHCGCPLKNKKKDTPKIDNKKVSNKFVWLVSLLPIISVLIYLLVWYLTKSYYLGIIILILIMCIFSILFIVLDYKKLNKLGLDKNTLGINKVYNIIIPKYLFKRFRVLNQNPSYFIVWIISAIIIIVMIILRINPLFLLTDTSKYIDQVYDYKLDSCSNGTVEELINEMIIDQDWQSEIDMQGNVTVTVNGISNLQGSQGSNIMLSFSINNKTVKLKEFIDKGKELSYSEFKVLQNMYCEMINFEMPEESEQEDNVYSNETLPPTFFKNINADDYIRLKEQNAQTLIYITRSDGSSEYCNMMNKVMEDVAYLRGIEINRLNSNIVDMKKITENEDYFKDGFGVPLLLIVGNGEIIDVLEGYQDMNSVNVFLNSFELTTEYEEVIKKVDFDEFKSIINANGYNMVYLSQQGCSHCENFKEKLTKVLENNKLLSYEMDISNLNSNELNELEAIFKTDGFNLSGTPTLIIVGNGIVDIRVGDISEDEIITFLREYEFID